MWGLMIDCVAPLALGWHVGNGPCVGCHLLTGGERGSELSLGQELVPTCVSSPHLADGETLKLSTFRPEEGSGSWLRY